MGSRSVLIFVLLAVGGQAAAQTPGEETPRPVQAVEETIDVRVINLEAVVTDGRGRRVPGLAVEDFRLLVDGVATPITYFSQIDEEKRRISGEIATGAGVTPAAESSWQSRNILVFLDEATMVKARRDFVLRSVVKQLDELAASDQMAVVAFTGWQLEVLCDWTGDRARLAAVFAAAKGRPSQGIHREVRRRELANDASLRDDIAATPQGSAEPNPWARWQAGGAASDSRGPMVQPGAFSVVRLQEPARVNPAQLFNPLDRFLGLAEAVAGAMRGLPAPQGRKMLMLLTEGFEHPFFARPVVQEASRLGYSLYPVDVKGIDSAWVQNDVEFAAPQPLAFIKSSQDSAIDSTLEVMAAATGGKASLNSNRLAALERLVEDSASYYLLGFSPTWRGDDRRHRIELTVARPGLEVRTRNSYFDASRRTRLALDADATLLFGRSRSEPRLIVTVGEAAAASGKRKIPISLGMPVESLAFFRHEKGFHAEAPVAMVVLDEKGKRKELPGLWLEIDMAELPREGTYARFDFSIEAGRRAQRIFITVHDALSGEAVWGEARLELPRRNGTTGRPESE